MGDVLYILFLSWVVIYADFRLTAHNVGAVWNGLGAIPSVIHGDAKSPMQYRVLVPWLCRWLGGDLVKTYYRIRWFAVVASVGASFWYFSMIGVNPYLSAAVLALFLVWAALYDYTDVYLEVAFLALGFVMIVGDYEYSLLVLSILAFVAALNKETAVFIPIAMAFTGNIEESIIVGGCFACGLYLPIQHYGARERYCEWVTVKRNINTIKDSFSAGKPILTNEYSLFFGLLAATVVMYAHTFLVVGLSAVEISMGLAFLVLLVPSMWREIRVFAPVMLALIPMVTRGLVS